MKFVAQKDFVLNNKYYFEKDEINIDNFEKIVKLNEKGFIKPLNSKELMKIKEELENKNKIINKKEE